MLLANTLLKTSALELIEVRVIDSRLPEDTPWKGASEIVELARPTHLRLTVLKKCAIFDLSRTFA